MLALNGFDVDAFWFGLSSFTVFGLFARNYALCRTKTAAERVHVIILLQFLCKFRANSPFSLHQPLSGGLWLNVCFLSILSPWQRITLYIVHEKLEWILVRRPVKLECYIRRFSVVYAEYPTRKNQPTQIDFGALPFNLSAIKNVYKNTQTKGNKNALAHTRTSPQIVHYIWAEKKRAKNRAKTRWRLGVLFERASWACSAFRKECGKVNNQFTWGTFHAQTEYDVLAAMRRFVIKGPDRLRAFQRWYLIQ